MNKFQWIVILAVLFVGGFTLFNYVRTPKLAYVNTQEVYDNFPLKKELEQKLIKRQEAMSGVLDSIGHELELLSVGLNEKKVKESDEKVKRYQALQQMYMQKKQEFEAMNSELSSKYTEQVWKQLNQFIKEYGEKKSYDFIHGVHGQGNLMYASDSKNITEEVKKFVNGRYEGDIK